mgnify:CR=1 FL=1
MQLYNSNEAVVSVRSMPRDIAKLCAHFISVSYTHLTLPTNREV